MTIQMNPYQLKLASLITVAVGNQRDETYTIGKGYIEHGRQGMVIEHKPREHTAQIKNTEIQAIHTFANDNKAQLIDMAGFAGLHQFLVDTAKSLVDDRDKGYISDLARDLARLISQTEF